MSIPPFARIATLAVLLAPVGACAQSPANQQAPGGHGGGAGMSFQQFEARRMGRLMAMDTDGDRRISRAEFLAGQQSGKGDPAQRFQRLDANGDGFVDRGEIDAMLKRRFDRMDADHNGTVTAVERAAAHQKQARSEDSD
jgi:hypothetical protein